MKRILCLATLSLLLLGCCEDIDPLKLVNPMIGTGFHGHTYPGATLPYGMVQLSPDTRTESWDACSGYHYDDSTIIGFSHTHLSGTGCADLLDILVSPFTDLPEKKDGLYVPEPHEFSHKDEHASPGYYSVAFASEGIFAEMTASHRTGVHRYSFKTDGERYILIDLDHVTSGEKVDMRRLEVVSSTEISGMRRTQGWVENQYVHFNARFSEPVLDFEIVEDRQLLVKFSPEVESVSLAVGLSAVSEENARENGIVEVPELDFDKVRKQAEAAWKNALGSIKVKGGSRRDMINFYTALYHTKLAPNLMTDVNGQYRRNDNTIATVPEGRTYRSTFSLWDTFRAWNPLQTLIDTAFVNDMIWSMLDMYDCSGELPIWPLSSGETGTMIGYHAVSVIADAYCKGIRGYDAQHAMEAMVRSSNINKKSSDKYLEYGYVPSNLKPESVSLTLEYAYDDWAIGRMAEAMGVEDIAARYYARAQNYMNVFDGGTSFFRGRNTDGSWSEPFEPFSTGRDYTEATPWHYRFFVPHDVNGMEQIFGGKDKFLTALEDLFSLEHEDMNIGLQDVTGIKGQYAHGNEPGHHMPYLYSYVGMPWRTQELTRELLNTMYSPEPEGIIGNEDCGQMSAWYVLSSLGFYQVCPGTDEFILTAPLFKNVELSLPGGKMLRIKANNPAKNSYVSDVLLNGSSLGRTFIKYEEIMNGGELRFVLSRYPDKAKDASLARPYSMSEGEFVSMPYTSAQVHLFTDSVYVDLASATEGAEIRYTLDGTEPDSSSRLYSEALLVDDSVVLKAKAFKAGAADSRTLVLKAEKAYFIPASYPGPLSEGVRYSWHEGIFGDVESMAASPRLAQGVMPVPCIADSPEEDHFGYVFSGYIDVPKRGVWAFMTKSDDGSVLEIDGRKVVDNDGSHASVSATGRIALDKGLHSFRLLYFEDYEGQELFWAWKAPGDENFTEIPEDRLFH